MYNTAMYDAHFNEILIIGVEILSMLMLLVWHGVLIPCL